METILNDTALFTANLTGINGTKLYFSQDLEMEPFYALAIDLIRYVLPIIIFVGTFGNVMSFVILVQREMRQTSTFFYLATLAVADTGVLYLSAFKTWFRVLTGYELLHQSDAACKILIFLTHFFVHFSAWLIVAITVERFLAVWFPLRATTMCSLARAKFATAMIAMIFILINSHIFWTAELYSLPSGQVRCMSYAYQNLVCVVFPWIYLVLYSFLPVLVLLLFNTLIIVNLVKTKSLFQAMTKTDQQMRYDHQKLAICLLVISFTWIFTTLPRPLYQLLMKTPTSTEKQAEALFVRTLSFILMYINHAVNFFIYGITGQRFRMELKRLFLCRVHLRKPKVKSTKIRTSSGVGSGHETSFSSCQHTSD
ncbi:growth hormone secretagogue receptor type 1-like [Saccostrea cucullata]|uniref:growth hormone secretagogue receptor type 1-like n=1 Tax=Saccostrea cuccullata TaxID=36930 RepID=UPI002ED5F544